MRGKEWLLKTVGLSENPMGADELFANCYIDEHISFVFSDELRAQGFAVKTAQELKMCAKDDKEQLDLAITLKSVLITMDKKTFIQDSNATGREHFGIILIQKELNSANAASAAKQVIDKYLNRYTKDEWKRLVVYL